MEMPENNLINDLGMKMDDIIDSHNYDSMLEYASELEDKAKNDSAYACTEVFYYIGTAYSILADYYRRQVIADKERKAKENCDNGADEESSNLHKCNARKTVIDVKKLKKEEKSK